MGGFILTLFGMMFSPWTSARWVGLTLCETFSLLKYDWKCLHTKFCKSLSLILFFSKAMACASVY